MIGYIIIICAEVSSSFKVFVEEDAYLALLRVIIYVTEHVCLSILDATSLTHLLTHSHLVQYF